MRNALILLFIVALALLVVAALNNDTVVDIDYLAGTWEDVSLVPIAAIVGGIVVAAGLLASWFALSAASAKQRRLETELQGTYERLRAAEAELARRVEATPGAAAAPATPDGASAGDTTVEVGDSADAGVAAEPLDEPTAEPAGSGDDSPADGAAGSQVEPHADSGDDSSADERPDGAAGGPGQDA